MTPEARLQYAIRVALGRRPDVLLWRNQTGVAQHSGRTISYGLTPGGTDLVGILTTDGIGRALFIEVKSARGRLSLRQQQFRDLVIARGAVYIEARSVPDVLQAIASAQAVRIECVPSPP